MSVPQNAKLSERMAILSAILPQVTTSAGGTVTSSSFNITGTTSQYFGRVLACALVASTNIYTTLLISQSQSAGTAVSTLASQTNTGNSTFVVEYDLNSYTQALTDTTNTWIALRVICTTFSPVTISGLVLGADGRYDPAATWNCTNVAATINSV